MSELKVITNNKPRPLYYFWELTEAQQETVKEDYDWLDSFDETQFFIYKDDIYCLDDFISTYSIWSQGNPFQALGWDGYKSFGFVGGLVVKLLDDNYYRDHYPGSADDYIIVGWY